MQVRAIAVVRIVLPTALLAAALALACETPVAPQPELARAPGPQAVRVEDLSPGGAWAHLQALAGIGPRVSGTEGAELARWYIVSQLEGQGIEVRGRGEEAASEPEAVEAVEGERVPGPAEPHNVLGVIPGSSEDLIILAAPYDTKPFESFEFIGANDGGSGAALLLGLAGILARDPLPYTAWLLFLDGEAETEDGALRGSRAAASQLRREGLVPRVRLLVFFNRICDPDLRIARDLLSHRIYRDEFWRAASRLGYREFFEQERFEQPPGAHWTFRSAGLRRVIAIMDTSFGGEEPPGLYADTEDDDLEHCAERSLEVVGDVTLEALRTITARLVKIDRFSTTPALQVAGSDEGEPPPEPGPEADPVEPESIEAPPSAEPDPGGAGPASADS